MLNNYRVLDLTDEKGSLCGKILGDLGADVIKIEKTGRRSFPASRALFITTQSTRKKAFTGLP